MELLQSGGNSFHLISSLPDYEVSTLTFGHARPPALGDLGTAICLAGIQSVTAELERACLEQKSA
eukprot:2319437-Prymnesium_polylepis.1